MAMALYEDLDRQPRVSAVPYHPSHRVDGSAPVATMDRLVGAAQAAGLAFLLVCWVAGAYAGIVYWSLQGSLLGVIASALIPGLAATSTWSAFAALEKPLEQPR
jgi:hypothetical protein